MFGMMADICIDACIDVVKMLPFLYVAFILIEALEHYSTDFTEQILKKVGKAGPVVGALAGCIPQCGFSVMAANLYAGGIISTGTLLAVFIATSDEAILIMLGNPGCTGKVLPLLGIKIVFAVVVGYITDIFLSRYVTVHKESGGLCEHCGCHKSGSGILKSAWNHTVKVTIYLFLFTVVLNLCIEVMGIQKLSEVLLGNSLIQPAIAALIGLIPNCAASVMLTQLYLNEAISFASVISGLCSGAGIGLVVLFRMNKNKYENLKILGLLYAFAVAAGVILEVI